MHKTVSFLCICALLLLPALAGVAAGGAGEEGTASEPSSDMAMGRYNEAPMLAALVAAGELPPVDERLPLEPALVYFVLCRGR